MHLGRLALAAMLAGCGDNTATTPLFNGQDLYGWYSWLPTYGRDNDPLGMFRVDDGMIHILGTDVDPALFEFGYLATTREYEDFHVRFEYRFGERHYVNFPKDSGFFIAVVGEDKIWPRSQECQVMVNDTGSLYLFEYATVDTTIDPALPDPTYLAGGVPYTTPRAASPFPRVTHAVQADDPDGWNTVEVIVDGERSEFIVNGQTTFVSTARRQPDPDAPDDPTQDIPLTKGRLILQQEGAEIFYRNLEITERP